MLNMTFLKFIGEAMSFVHTMHLLLKQEVLNVGGYILWNTGSEKELLINNVQFMGTRKVLGDRYKSNTSKKNHIIMNFLSTIIVKIIFLSLFTHINSFSAFFTFG